MSTDAIGFYTRQRYGDGCFMLYYDFENYDGDYILTSGSGDYATEFKYSGKIEGDLTAFKDNKFGSGSFNLSPGDNNYIKIQNIIPDDDLIKARGWTFLVSQEKINNECGTIFSNFAGEQFSTSGWEFGVNNANQLYFKYQEALISNQTPGIPYNNILTLNANSAAKNYYAVTYAANSIELARYDPQSQQWDMASRVVNPAYMRNNKDWYIGKGEYEYIGYIDKFAFFNTPISKPDLEGIINASYQGLEFNHGEECTTISGVITGHEAFPTGETGVLFTSGELSGFREYTISGNNLISEPLTGDVPSGSVYFESSGLYSSSGNQRYPQTGQFFKRSLAMEDLVDVVSGFHVFESGFETVVRERVNKGVDITGVIWTGSGVGEPLRAPDQCIVTNGGETILTGDSSTGDCSYSKDTLSYLGERGGGTNIYDGEEGDFMEYILDTYSEVNFYAGYGYSTVAERDAFFVRPEYRGRGEDINLFLNGIYQITGEIELGDPDPLNPLDPNSKVVNIENGNYALFENTVLANPTLFSSTDSVLYDESLFEINGRKEISNISQYTSAPFGEIEIENSTVFFNGQKIYEGIDWYDNGGFFPIGDITTVTGIFESRSSYASLGAIRHSGINLYDLRNETCGNFVAYINGVRAPKEDFIYYSSGVNLIDGRKNLIELPYKKLYNITSQNTFF